MSTNAPALILGFLATALAGVAAFLAYAAARYSPIIARIFEEKPLFLPLRLAAEPGGEDVRFPTQDGLSLAGTYYKARAEARVGVLVYCHEYLSDRASYRPYADGLRDLGYDVFTFDFRNHGRSDSDPAYKPLQWATGFEVRDLRGALAYLRTRPDRDPAGFGLFGVSRGGSTALLVASKDAGVWGVITDGAFPTRGTMLAYILRWAEIYVSNRYIWRSMPVWVFAVLGWVGRKRSERRLNCRFPDVERAAGRLAPRPWLMIHGAKDAYIGPEIAKALFAEAREPKEIWVVPKAKHNRCRQTDPAAYAERVTSFLGRYAPRRGLAAAVAPAPAAPTASMAEGPGVADDAPVARELAAPVPG